MSTDYYGFGKFISIRGGSGVFQSTAVPIDYLQDLKSNVPIPFTFTSLAATLNAGVTHPLNIWVGNDFITLKETLAYTFINGTNTVFIDSSGVTVAAQVTAATIYYLYIGRNTAGTIRMYPSASYPYYVEGPYESGYWAHPGVSRGAYWSYVGFMQNTATTPAFTLLTKKGFTYSNPTPTGMGVINIATVSTSAVAVDLSDLVPVHQGVELGGYIRTDTTAAVGDTLDIGASSLAANAFRATAFSITYGATQSFYGLVPSTSGYLWAKASASLAAGGDCLVTTLRDVV